MAAASHSSPDMAVGTSGAEAFPPLNRNQRGADPKGPVPQIDPNDFLQMTPEEREIEEKYRADVAANNSPWSAKARAFMGAAKPTSEDLTLSRVPDLNTSSSFIQLEESDQQPVRKGWGLCLAGIFAGRFPGKDAVQTLMRRWPSQARVTYHSRGWMFFQFPTLKGLTQTLEKGPFSIFGIPLLLELVDDNFKFDKRLETNLPVWIRIPDLPPTLWTRSAIQKIASTVGIPIAVDEATIKKEVLDGPRVQVLVDASVRPRPCIELRTFKGDVHLQRIVFELQPKFCPKCLMFGHYGTECPGPKARGRHTSRPNPANGKRQPPRENKGPPRQNSRPASRPPQNETQGTILADSLAGAKAGTSTITPNLL